MKVVFDESGFDELVLYRCGSASCVTCWPMRAKKRHYSSRRCTHLTTRGMLLVAVRGPPAEVDEVDLDAVEAHLMKRLQVKVLARIGGKHSVLKRVYSWHEGR